MGQASTRLGRALRCQTSFLVFSLTIGLSQAHSVPEGFAVSFATALAVLPTNRPRAGSKLTDHSSDTES
jgi:hypothetical protein